MSLVLHPAEEQVSSKLGEFDESLMVDLPWLEDVLMSQKLVQRDRDMVIPKALAQRTMPPRTLAGGCGCLTCSAP